MPRYSIVPSRLHRSAAGQLAGFYGANPWTSEAQRVSEGWHTVSRGFTLRDNRTGAVDHEMVPFGSVGEAAGYAAHLNAHHHA